MPAADLRAALRDLGRLGTVRSQSQAGQDVTAGYVSAADRLQSARAERRSLLRRLERSGSDTQTESLRRQLELNASQVSALRSRLRDLRVRTDYAAISLTLGSRDDGGATGGAGDGLGSALDDALASLSNSVELLVRALGVAIPIGILAALAWLAARSARRRRRDAALPAPLGGPSGLAADRATARGRSGRPPPSTPLMPERVTRLAVRTRRQRLPFLAVQR